MVSAVVMNWLLAATVAQQGYQAKRGRDVRLKQEDAAKEAAEKAKERASNIAAQKASASKKRKLAEEFETKDPYAETGGIPMTLKKRLRITSGANI